MNFVNLDFINDDLFLIPFLYIVPYLGYIVAMTCVDKYSCLFFFSEYHEPVGIASCYFVPDSFARHKIQARPPVV